MAAKLFKVKALKMFKVSVNDGKPQMINPGDVVEVDAYMFGMLMQSGKTEVTTEPLRINPDYKPPERETAADPMTLFARTVENFTKVVKELSQGRQKAL